MATTLAQAISQLGIDAGIVGHKDFPKAILTRYLNLAQKYVQKTLNGLGIKKWETGYDCTANLAAAKYNGVNVKVVTLAQIKTGSTYDVAIASNSIRLFEVGDSGSLATSTNFGIAKPANEETFHKLLSDPYLAPTITEPRFLWQNEQILLSPPTIASAKIHFYRVAKDLSNDADTFEIPDEFIELVIKKAKIDVQGRLNLLNNKEEAIQELDKEIKDQYAAYFQGLNEVENSPTKLQ